MIFKRGSFPQLACTLASRGLTISKQMGKMGGLIRVKNRLVKNWTNSVTQLHASSWRHFQVPILRRSGLKWEACPDLFCMGCGSLVGVLLCFPGVGYRQSLYIAKIPRGPSPKVNLRGRKDTPAFPWNGQQLALSQKLFFKFSNLTNNIDQHF